MPHYNFYIWMSYGLTFLILSGIILSSVRLLSIRKQQIELWQKDKKRHDISA